MQHRPVATQGPQSMQVSAPKRYKPLRVCARSGTSPIVHARLRPPPGGKSEGPACLSEPDNPSCQHRCRRTGTHGRRPRPGRRPGRSRYDWRAAAGIVRSHTHTRPLSSRISGLPDLGTGPAPGRGPWVPAAPRSAVSRAILPRGGWGCGGCGAGRTGRRVLTRPPSFYLLYYA